MCMICNARMIRNAHMICNACMAGNWHACLLSTSVCVCYLINVATYSVVQYKRHEELLNVIFWNVEVLGDERYPDACVGLYNVEHHLSADVLQQILNVVADERVIIYGPPALTNAVTNDYSEYQMYLSRPEHAE